MIIQKLRLEKGWSQQQLAEMTGLSKRTIQRIENGNTPSVESVKSLAAVFELDFAVLNEALAENLQDTKTIVGNTDQEKQNTLQLTNKEKKAYRHIRELKDFYIDLFTFLIVIAFLTLLNWYVSPDYWWVVWVALAWGLKIILRAVRVFMNPHLFSAEWEKHQRDKFLNKDR